MNTTPTPINRVHDVNAVETVSLVCHPGVFLIEQDYEIILLCNKPAMASIVVDGRTFTDNVNGVMRSDTDVHKIKIPTALLDKAKAYRVHITPLADHCNYYPKPDPTEAYEYPFTPRPDRGRREGLRPGRHPRTGHDSRRDRPGSWAYRPPPFAGGHR